MLTDEQIASLSPTERRQLVARLVRPVDDVVPSQRWLRRTREARVALMVLSAAVLVPWIGYLAATLPRVYVARHWDVAWVGFDLMLLVLITSTAVLGYLRRQLFVLTAFAAGVLLVCDAWFDVLTAHGDDRTWSVVTAIAIELPLAALLVTGALQMLRLMAARMWLLEPGGRAWQIPIPLPDVGDRAVRRHSRRPSD